MGLKRLSLLRDFIRDLIENIVGLPRLVRKQIRAAINDVMQVRENLKNMTKTNMKLGKYHLYRRNLGDAIFRFRIVEKFFDPGNN